MRTEIKVGDRVRCYEDMEDPAECLVLGVGGGEVAIYDAGEIVSLKAESVTAKPYQNAEDALAFFGEQLQVAAGIRREASEFVMSFLLRAAKPDEVVLHMVEGWADATTVERTALQILRRCVNLSNTVVPGDADGVPTPVPGPVYYTIETKD